MEHTKSTTSHFKMSVPGSNGGILFIETGLCQPFYYVKLNCVEKDKFTNQFNYYDDRHNTSNTQETQVWTM